MANAAIVLVRHGGNHVEIPTNEPWSSYGDPEVLQLQEEGELVLLALGAVHACDPPVLASRDWGDSGRDMVKPDHRIG